MKVIGLDTSLAGTGIASNTGWCELVGRAGVTKLALDARLAALDGLLREILLLVAHPDLVVIESPSLRSLGMGTVERHALWWLLVRHLRSVEVPVALAAPSSRMLYATGKGMATKEVVVDAAARRWPAFPTKGNNNLVDAVVLAAIGADWLGEPLCPMPAQHRRALAKVVWPEPPAGRA